MIYADNANHIATTSDIVDSNRLTVSKVLNDSGLDTHEVISGSTLVECLGVRVDGRGAKSG